MKHMKKLFAGIVTAALVAGTGIAVSSTAQAQSSQQVQGFTNVKGVYYKNCTAVRKAGKAPLYKGEPGYRLKLDRDKDGIACE